jgi:hypothetical protein
VYVGFPGSIYTHYVSLPPTKPIPSHIIDFLEKHLDDEWIEAIYNAVTEIKTKPAKSIRN